MQLKRVKKTNEDYLLEKSQFVQNAVPAEVYENESVMEYLKPRIEAANHGDVVRITDKEIIEATIKRSRAKT